MSRGCWEGPCQPAQGEAPAGRGCTARPRGLPGAASGGGCSWAREAPRERAGPARVLLVHQHSAVQPGVCWQRIHSSALTSDVSYNLPARRPKLMMVFRANDQPGVAGGRCNTGRFGAMPAAFHRCPAHAALPASPPAISRGRELFPALNLLHSPEQEAGQGSARSAPEPPSSQEVPGRGRGLWCGMLVAGSGRRGEPHTASRSSCPCRDCFSFTCHTQPFPPTHLCTSNPPLDDIEAAITGFCREQRGWLGC